MISLTKLTMRYGAKILFKDVSLQFNPGHRYGLIGANGCGKSTLIKILTGEITPDQGEIALPQRNKLGFLKQDHFIYHSAAILDVVLQGRKALWEALVNKETLLKKEHFDEADCTALMKWDAIIDTEDGYSAEGEAAKLLEGLGIREDYHRQPLKALSGGYKLRVLLAQVLFSKPDTLILDEPTNHLDLYSIKWLEDYLKNFPGTLVVTSHDRDFLNGVCTDIADVDYGTIKIYKGNYELFQKQKEADRSLKEHTLLKHDKRRADLQGFIDRFGAKATKAKQAQSKARLVDKIEEEMEAVDLVPSSRIYPQLQFTSLRHSGVKVLTANNICKAYGPKTVLKNVSFEIERGEKIAFIGPNGIGKSTLLEILTKHQNADLGNFEWGFAARIAYFPQDHTREVKGAFTLLDWLSQFDRTIPQEKLREILGSVLFSGDTVNQSIHTLSGGETARLLLAKLMLEKPNILIFDEPTNHLDMEAIEELSNAIEKFPGTVLFVSHHRRFVSQLANRIIELSSSGMRDFRGTYEEYLATQQPDHLSSSLPLSRRYAHEENTPPTSHSTSLSYTEQKKIKNQTAQLKKKVTACEEQCHQLEHAIKELDNRMAAEGFYQQTPREEQQRFMQEKSHLENQLGHALEQWEKASVELHNGEGS